MKIMIRTSALIFLLSQSSSLLASPLSSTQQTQLREIEVILKSEPQLIEQLHQSLTNYVSSQNQFENNLAQHRDWLFNNPIHPFYGNPDAKHVIINFTDHNCPYCKKLESALEQLVKERSDIKVINVYVPIKHMMSQQQSISAAQYALNVWQQSPNDYAKVDKLLFANRSMHNSESINKVAKATNTQSLLVEDKALKQAVEKNYQVFQDLGLRGTPAMLINDQVLAGYMPYEQLKPVLAKEFPQ
ncbi:DsbA family protein [Vibrio tapetis]|uniref:Thioredoxin domain-containing protein n=1 Tax=Vibrio tapetis subsp. tapetis TaxID=1671868 RepID=A0A2N8ZC99_9VIBR|nr:DsbA family protein [Vibrio tapetis]SON49536.1 conserved exported protein of unknown function [Vibrio tapetis subsp. tapetis]